MVLKESWHISLGLYSIIEFTYALDRLQIYYCIMYVWWAQQHRVQCLKGMRITFTPFFFTGTWCDKTRTGNECWPGWGSYPAGRERVISGQKDVRMAAMGTSYPGTSLWPMEVAYITQLIMEMVKWHIWQQLPDQNIFVVYFQQNCHNQFSTLYTLRTFGSREKLMSTGFWTPGFHKEWNF